MTDNVNHPDHYSKAKVEVIEGIESWGLSYHKGNAVKYIARAGKKDPSFEKELEDLNKAIWYLRREIELRKAKWEEREPCRPNDMNKDKVKKRCECDSPPKYYDKDRKYHNI